MRAGLGAQGPRDSRLRGDNALRRRRYVDHDVRPWRLGRSCRREPIAEGGRAELHLAALVSSNCGSDRRCEQRVEERQRRLGPQQACLRQAIGRTRNGLAVEVGHRRDMTDRRFVTENLQGLRDGRCLGRQSCQPQADDPPPRIRRQVSHELGCGRGHTGLSSRQFVEQLGHQERVALGQRRA